MARVGPSVGCGNPKNMRGSNEAIRGEDGVVDRRAHEFNLHVLQFLALLRKDYLIRKRKKLLNVLLLASCFLCVMMIWALEKSVLVYERLNPAFQSKERAVVSPVGNIPDCSTNLFMREQDIPCYTLVYAPDTKEVTQLVKRIASMNKPTIPEYRFKGFQNGQEIDTYLFEHPNTVLAAIEIFKESNTSYAFSVQVNSTARWFKGKFQEPTAYIALPVQMAVERAIATEVTGENIDWHVNIAEYPHPAVQALPMKSQFAPAFYMANMIFLYVLQVYELVEERERGTVHLLGLHGMRTSAYWSAIYCSYSSLFSLDAVLLSLFSSAFGFETFSGTHFWYGLVLLVNVSQAVAALGFLTSALLRKASHAVLSGTMVFILTWACLVVISFGFPYGTAYSSMAWVLVFSAVPWSILAHGMSIIKDGNIAATTGLELGQLLGILWLQTVFFLALAMFLDANLPDQHGNRRILSNGFSLRWYSKGRGKFQASVALDMAREEAAETEQSIQKEKEVIQEECEKYLKAEKKDGSYAVEIFGIRQVNIRRRKASDGPELHGDWFGIKRGECFCLLGPNSAGKTAILKSMLGAVSFSEGDALIHGSSILSKQGHQKARAIIGYSPQIDSALVDLMTPCEFSTLLNSLRGYRTQAPAMRYLDNRYLMKDLPLGSRKIASVVFAMIGAPQVLILDEPTAGLEPSAKRKIWELIHEYAANRTILVASHSMEEAEALADRIGIMVRGKLRCLGTPVDLKARFGSGYKITICIDGKGSIERVQAKKEKIAQIFTRNMRVKDVEYSDTFVHFLLPHEEEDKLPLMLSHLRNNASLLGIRDLQLRPTPLEEVFMTITKKAELENAEREGRFENLILAEEQIAIKVPIGADYIESPGGKFYRIFWTQDRFGRLKIRDYRID